MVRKPVRNRMSPRLHMEIRETPVPTGETTGVLPDMLIRGQDTDEESIRQDIASRLDDVDIDDIAVSITSKFTRGLGESTNFTIMVDANRRGPDELNNMAEALVSAGYMFNIVEVR